MKDYKIVILPMLLITMILTISCIPITEDGLQKNGVVYDITVKNDDIYAVGIYYYSGEMSGGDLQRPCYWENGVKKDLKGYITKEIFFDNDDMYITGYYVKPNGLLKSCYWKNGERFDYEQNGSGLVIHNGDLYTVGYYEEDGQNHACYWKNEERFDLPGGVEAVGIDVEGNNTLVYGIEEYGTVEDYCYWINGVIYYVEDDVWEIKDVCIKYGVIYVVASYTYHDEDKYTHFYPCYWINGVRGDLPMEPGLGGVSQDKLEIFIDNGNFYVFAIHSNEMLRYWKNGEFVELPSEYNYNFNSSFIYDDGIYVCGSYNERYDYPTLPFYRVNFEYVFLDF
jgi:hypothetical protein